VSVCFDRLNELLLFNRCLERMLEDVCNPVHENEYCLIDSDSETGSRTV